MRYEKLLEGFEPDFDFTPALPISKKEYEERVVRIRREMAMEELDALIIVAEGVNRYHPSNIMPKNYYKIDYRSSSYYVPRMVKDELSLIMNRPKDKSFVPILGVAFLAAQLASKYIFVKGINPFFRFLSTIILFISSELFARVI